MSVFKSTDLKSKYNIRYNSVALLQGLSAGATSEWRHANLMWRDSDLNKILH